jgi:hypothetical protein
VADTSLKAFIPVLAKGVHMTPAALYERQRALVRAGLLHSQGGRGPGSGVRATPESVAMLFISILATGNLSETEERSKAIAGLKSVTKRCPITGKKTFASALTAVLSSEELAKQLRWIDVERSGAEAGASLVFKKPAEVILTHDEKSELLNEAIAGRPWSTAKAEATKDYTDSRFGHEYPRFKSMLNVRAQLSGYFDRIAHGLKEVEKDARQHHPTRKK